MTRTLLHFGLAKTATTYLQRRVFPSAKGVNFLGKPFDLEQDRLERWAEKYIRYRVQKMHRFDLFFEFEDVMRCRPYDSVDLGHYEAHLRNILSPGDLNVWSHEGYLRPGRKSSPFDRPVAIDNIRRVFEAAGSDEVHALMVLRDTKTLLRSYAAQFHRDFDYLQIGDVTLEEMLAFREGQSSDRLAGLFWRIWYEYLDYPALIDDLIAGFGAERVHVLVYEDVVRDWGLLQGLLQGIHPGVRCRFPDVRENTTEAKPDNLSGPLRAYIESIEAFDVARLYPGNAGVVRAYRQP